MPAAEVRYCTRPGCPNHLKGQQRRFCSNSCRAIFSNQQKQADARALTESIALESIRAKIEPVTRELLTDRVLNELRSLTDLLPAAVKELMYELSVDEEGNPVVEDSELRHKAAIQVLKFTVSNSSIAPPSLDATPAALQVIIGAGMESRIELRPGADAESTAVEAERECLECHLFKSPAEFVGESNRCQVCHDKLLGDVEAKYGADMVRSVHASNERGPAEVPVRP